MSRSPARKCAFLTQRQPSASAADDQRVAAPLAELGWQLETLPWDASVDWSQYRAVVIRSTWDYIRAPEQFFAALERIDRQSNLANALDLVRWNLRKTYLRDLADRGAAVLPTYFGRGFEAGTLGQIRDRLSTDEIVVKPVVGADAAGVRRLSKAVSAEDLDWVREHFRERDFLAQPFVPAVVEEGEHSLIFFAGKLSHAVLKVPKQGEFRVQEKLGGRTRAISADPEMMTTSRQLLELISPAPLYARIDLVRFEGRPRIMEVELIEPTFYLGTDPSSARRFATAIDHWFGDPSESR